VADEPLYIQDLNTQENIKRGRRIDILTGAMAATTFLYALLLASSPSDSSVRRNAWIQVLSITFVWGSLYVSWLYTHTPLKIFRDRIEVMKQVIPLSRMRGITKRSDYGEMIYKIKYKGIWHKFTMPWKYECKEGSPQSAAFDTLINEHERIAGRTILVS
jgi:hypothetical protein